MVLHFSSGSPFEKTIGYSRAVVDGNLVYVSGTTGYDYAAMVLPADPADQARNALRNIAHVLEEIGAGMRDIVRVRYYVADRADWPAIMPVLGEVFRDIRPAATMVVAGLMEPQMKIEIEVTARIGAGGR